MAKQRTPVLSDSGRAVFKKIISIWPPIIRTQRKEKILRVLSLLMQSRKVRKADQDLVIEATRLVVPKSYDPLFHMIEDMETFTRKLLDPFQDIKAYKRIPVRVKRWKRTGGRRRGDTAIRKKVIAFCASPRKNGNTDLLIEEALNGVRDAGAQTEKIMYGLVFVQKLPKDSDWHYEGADVKFGDADTPIFWYKPADSETYRVIYGDLHVEDVAADDLPESP